MKVYCIDCEHLFSISSSYDCGHPTNLVEVDTPLKKIYSYIEYPEIKNKNNNCKDFSPKKYSTHGRQ
jgi:hypothetical protein